MQPSLFDPMQFILPFDDGADAPTGESIVTSTECSQPASRPHQTPSIETA